jgi:peptide/nickel transport system permease protein
LKLARILERIMVSIPIMLGVAIIVFLFMRLTPGADPVDLMMGEAGHVSAQEMEALRQEFLLDEPIHVQLYHFLAGCLRGDLGTSFIKRKPVTTLILECLPATIELALGALFLSLLISVPIGIISAVKQYSFLDRASMTGAFIGISMPPFWLGIILIILFSASWGLFPSHGRLPFTVGLDTITGFYILDSILTRNWSALASTLHHLFLPSLALGAATAATVARMIRSSMLEVLRQDYIVLARAKGLTEYKVIVKHALRNALIPTVTIVAIQLGVFLGGNMIVETVFGWPGLGRLVVDAIQRRDFPLVQGAVIIYAFTFVMANLLADIIYTFVNPKIEL